MKIRRQFKVIELEFVQIVIKLKKEETQNYPRSQNHCRNTKVILFDNASVETSFGTMNRFDLLHDILEVPLVPEYFIE